MSNNFLDNRVFLLEIVKVNNNQTNYPVRPSGHSLVKVPLSRMSQEIRRLHCNGYSIVGITCVNGMEKINQTPWWVEICTAQPRCVYYFGPFASWLDAKGSQAGYVEDLQDEDAQGIIVQIKRCNPEILTVFET